MSQNRVVLAVAGSRKTQSIVDTCANGPATARRLVLTFTISAQKDVETRLRQACTTAEHLPMVSGWYSFLLHHWVRPYLPLLYPSRRLNGLNFEAKTEGVDYSSGEKRFLDNESRAYKRYLAKFAHDVAGASNGSVIDRLQHMYDEIYVDEVQDLTGYDLEILELLLQSRIKVTLVGDVRQSLFNTNPQDPKHKQYRDLKMLDWFELQERRGRLVIVYSHETWRCNQTIATFSDSIFPESHGFPATASMQGESTGHDGIFTVTPQHVVDYVSRYDPLCLRHDVRTSHPEGLEVLNFGIVKGLTRPRVLIFPTGPIEKFLRKATPLKGKSACGLYVAVTRAQYSVAFVTDTPVPSFTNWTPDYAT